MLQTSSVEITVNLHTRAISVDSGPSFQCTNQLCDHKLKVPGR